MSITRHDVDGNKAKVRSFIDAWNNWDFTRFHELMADSCQLVVGAGTVSCSPSSTREIADGRWRRSPTGASSCSIPSRTATGSSALMPFSGTQAGDLLDTRPLDDAYG